jgi:hypothetical protein
VRQVVFVNQVAMGKYGDHIAGGFVAAVGLFWCRGMRKLDQVEGVDRRTLKTFTPESNPRYISRSDPGHTFEAYAFPAGASTSRWQVCFLGSAHVLRAFFEPTRIIWQDGELLGRFVAEDGESVVEIRLPEERLLHPTEVAAAAARQQRQDL